ncbi:MAG: hypothetical protein ACXW2P_01800 [Thermoanaerobaculia bacterium]
MTELALIMLLSLAARDEAAVRYDQSVQRYVAGIHAGTEDLDGRREEMRALHVALRAILERDRMREIDLRADVDRLLGAATPADDEELLMRQRELALLRAERERYLARRTVIEGEQQATIAAALVTTRTQP